jgi:T-complex protein 1 subunit beta
MYQPKRVVKAKILIANTPMDTDKVLHLNSPLIPPLQVKVFGSRVRVESVAKVAELEAAEKLKMKQKVEKIVAYGINVFINRQLIYNFPEQLFADAGIMAIEHADFEGIERLALLLGISSRIIRFSGFVGGEIVSTFDSPDTVKFGSCDLIEEVMIGEDRLLRFSGVPAGECRCVCE